jgi:hypothetical protein
MFFIWGERMYGKVDVVGDLLHVHTRFFHMWYFPLFPQQTYIVIADLDSEDGFRCVPIDMSTKSVLLGWVRGALVAAGIVGVVFYLRNVPAGQNPVVLEAAAFLGLILAYILTFLFSKASYKRALELGDQVGIPRHTIAEIYFSAPTSEVSGPDDWHAPEDPEDRSLV